MPPNILRYATAAHFGGNPIHQAITERRRAEEAKAAVVVEVLPYNKHLRDYIKDVCPDFPFTKHTLRLIEIGEAIIAGDLRWVMIELPPRHFKSTIFSRFMPGCYLRRNPQNTVGLGAYSQALAQEFGQHARDYYVASGGVLDQSKKGVGRWATHTKRGGMWVAGVGKGTGLPANLLGIDDPVKNREEADSAAYRRRLHSWLDTVMFTRVEPDARGWVTHTRWHELDAIGYLLYKNTKLERENLSRLAKPWHVIHLPMIATGRLKSLPKTVTREPENRQPGEALDPTRYDEDFAAAQKATMTERDWESIYQGDPTPEGGTVFLRDHIHYYVLPGQEKQEGDVVMPAHGIRRLVSVDSTFKNSAGADMVGIGFWLQTQEYMFRVDQVNKRMGFTETLDTLRNLYPAWKFTDLLIEDTANGPAIIDTLKREAVGYAVHAVNPLGGKVARAEAASVQFKQGRILLPRYAPWLQEYIDQLLSFPAGTFDDLVDETTQVINFCASTGPMTVETVTWGHGTTQATPDPRHLAAQSYSGTIIS
jgi:predicted phage terminase large subunit-like protein